jgi:hypothetical protein
LAFAWLPPYDAFLLYYPSRVQVPLKVRVFIEFLPARRELRPQPADRGQP